VEEFFHVRTHRSNEKVLRAMFSEGEIQLIVLSEQALHIGDHDMGRKGSFSLFQDDLNSNLQ